MRVVTVLLTRNASAKAFAAPTVTLQPEETIEQGRTMNDDRKTKPNIQDMF